MSAAALRAGLVNTIVAHAPLPSGAVVEAADDVPEDDNAWPVVFVRAPQTVRTRRIESQLWFTWSVQVVVGTRSVKGDASAAADAADARDALLDVVTDTLALHRGVAPGITARVGGERRGNVITDRKGRRWTVGEVTVTASGPRTPEPQPPAYNPTDLQITVSVAAGEQEPQQ